MPASRARRYSRFLFWISIVAVATGIAAGSSVVLFSDLPQVEALERFEPKGVTTLKDIRGRVIHEFFVERRIPVPFDKIPERLRKAFLASEDWRFYDHFGFDVKGLLRAVVKNIWEQRYAEGASTITQQLSKVLFLNPEKTLGRKLKEALLAVQIERRYSKNEILALYLNQIYLGEGAYGVEAAARTYFQKSIGELSVAETAMLAGLPQGPNRFSPFKHPDRALLRRDTILQSMFERGLISKTELQTARETTLPEKPPEGVTPLQSYFAAYVLNELEKEIDEQQIFSGHLEIQTTLDLDLQEAADRAVEHGIRDYAERHRIKLDQRKKLPQAALLAIDPHNGEIRAMVGGRSFPESQYNRAVQARRQPGSAFKPVVYLAALERGYTQASTFEDMPISFDLPEGAGKWEPKNYEDDYDGMIPLRVALEKSKNVVAVRLLQAIGLSALQQMTARLGFESAISHNLSSALGSSSVTFPELARAYATFATLGIRPQIRGVRSVRSAEGTELWPEPSPSEVVLDPKTAYVLDDMLSGVIRFGTGSFAAELPCAVFGKTGTTDDNVDSVFAGFHTNLVAITWVGFDDRKSLGVGETGARAAGPIWKEFMTSSCSTASTDAPLPPPGVLLVDVDHSSGRLPARYCTDVLAEAFVEGTEPKESCTEEEL